MSMCLTFINLNLTKRACVAIITIADMPSLDSLQWRIREGGYSISCSLIIVSYLFVFHNRETLFHALPQVTSHCVQKMCSTVHVLWWNWAHYTISSLSAVDSCTINFHSTVIPHEPRCTQTPHLKRIVSCTLDKYEEEYLCFSFTFCMHAYC